MVPIRNRPAGAPYLFPAAEIVDPGFLELVRYGIRRPGDPLIEDSLRVVDAVLKTDFPAGPCWKRYNHDGYGQRDDGGAFVGWGVGRPWPLLTGERGHYELAAGRDSKPYLQAMENFATATRLLPEQVWDRPDLPEDLLLFRQTDRRRDAPDVGPRRVHQAAALGRRRRHLRSHPRSRRALPRRQAAPARSRFGNTTGKSALSRSPASCGSNGASPSCCTGARTNGITPKIAARPIPRWVSISSILMLLPPTARPSASPSIGSRAGNGKAAITRWSCGRAEAPACSCSLLNPAK